MFSARLLYFTTPPEAVCQACILNFFYNETEVIAIKTALITGGTSGIGLAAARIFLAHDFNCVLVGRNAGRGRNALETLGGSDRRVFFIAADVSNVADCDRILAETLARFGRIDALINSAGIYLDGAIQSVDEPSFDRLFGVNVKGTFFMIRAAVDELIKTRGAIVNVASDAGLKGNYFCSLYSASKGAVIALTKSLALELAHIPVRVNAVAPGDVLTPMTVEQLKRSGESIDDLASVYPMRRIAAAEEVAESIFFLASEKASFITGAILSVDGGLTA